MMPPVTNKLIHNQSSHCESGVVSNMLTSRGLKISEPMAFGISSAMTFAYLPFVKISGMPLIAYRMPPKTIINSVTKKLGIKLYREKFSDAKKGMEKLDSVLSAGHLVGMQTSVYWLPYFPEDMRFHFNAHNLMIFGKNEDGSYQVSDPVFEDVVNCPYDDLKKARFAKGALAPKGLMYWIEDAPSEVDFTPHIYSGIRKTAKMMAGLPVPGINFFGTKGIEMMAKSIRGLKGKKEKYNRMYLAHIVRMQEEIGTGGAGFRFMFASFLDESAQLTQDSTMAEAATLATEIGDEWREFAMMAVNYCKGKAQITLDDISELLLHCSSKEKQLRSQLLELTTT